MDENGNSTDARLHQEVGVHHQDETELQIHYSLLFFGIKHKMMMNLFVNLDCFSTTMSSFMP